MSDPHYQELQAAHHAALTEGTRYIGLLGAALEAYARVLRDAAVSADERIARLIRLEHETAAALGMAHPDDTEASDAAGAG